MANQKNKKPIKSKPKKPTAKKPSASKSVEKKTAKPTKKETTVSVEKNEKAVVEEVKEQKHKNFSKTIIFIIGGIAILTLLAIVSYLGYEYTYKNKVYPGLTLDGQSMAGKDYPELAEAIEAKKTTILENGLVFSYQDKSYTVEPVIAVEDSDQDVALLQINTDNTAQDFFAIGRSNDAKTNVYNKIKYLFNPQDIELQYDLNTETIQSILENEFAEYVELYENSTLEISDIEEIKFTEHKDGKDFDWENIMLQVTDDIENYQPVNIELELITNPAPVSKSTAQSYETEVEQIMNLAPLTLSGQDNTYEVDQATFNSWLTINTNGVDLNDELVDLYLDDVAGEIDIPVEEGRFSLDIVNDEVQLQQFKEGQDGLEINTEKTISNIKNQVLDNNSSSAELVIEVTHPRATPDNLNELGIKELLGTGETNFSGSPYNRRFNISKGADILNGLLIAPGETFSLIGMLSPVDTAHGWLSELVIKGDKLEKEAGGGLCQIGTTAFRAAMMSGLEIVERRNHSWAVSYYDYKGKAGIDATIYEPSPDFKFKNDTEHYILWRSRIEGNDIYFEFWGTSDGRNGYFTDATNYGYVYPGETEEVIDESLAPGTRDCVQHAYTGVTAEFDYVIERANGTVDNTTYTSVYKARPARCIIGPEPEETEEKTPTDTNNTSDDSTKIDDSNSNTNTNTNTDSSNKNTNKKKKDKNTNSAEE